LRGFGAERDMDEGGLAVEFEKILVAVDIRHAGVGASFHLIGEAAVDEFLAKGHEFLFVDDGFFVGEDEEADAVVFDQVFDLIDHIFGLAYAVVAPEFPSVAEGTG